MKFLLAVMCLSVFSTLVHADIYSVNCRVEKMCPYNYRPTTCVYKKELKVEGDNYCSAIAEIETLLCAEDGRDTVQVDTKDLDCQYSI